MSAASEGAADGARERIAAHLSASSGAPAEVLALAPLGGGACQDNRLVEARIAGEARRLVLRSDARTSLPGSLDREGEKRVIDAAVRAGVRTPAARWFGRGLLREGPGAYFL